MAVGLLAVGQNQPPDLHRDSIKQTKEARLCTTANREQAADKLGSQNPLYFLPLSLATHPLFALSTQAWRS